jgi:F420-non-reducing hydrogenase iron-sulfur subunit
MGLGGRLHLAWISSAEAQKFARVVADFTDHIRGLGPNPLTALDLNHGRPQGGPPSGRPSGRGPKATPTRAER